MIKQLAHINIISNDAPSLLDFYTEKLGLSIKFSLKDDKGEEFGWYINCGNLTFIEIFDQKGAVKQWGGEIIELSNDRKFKHLCFQVTEIEQYKKELETKGLSITEISTGMDNCRQMWVKDPDGNDIELMEYTDTSLQL